MKEFTCVSCPIGCRLRADTNEDGSYKISGNSCKRGIDYGLQEMTDSRRNFSSTVRISKGFLPLLPVKTSAPLPKDKIFEAMNVIKKTQAAAPIDLGTVIIKNILNTGIDIVAARSIGAEA